MRSFVLSSLVLLAVLSTGNLLAADSDAYEDQANLNYQKVDTKLYPVVFAKMINSTNFERIKINSGLRALQYDPYCQRLAEKWGSHMARTGQFRHSGYNVGENIAMGQRNTAQAMNSWMNSSGHRANILNRGYTKIGCAAYRGRNGAYYWIQCFK